MANDREQRGLAIAALFRIDKQGGKYIVPSQSADGKRYVVDPEKQHCTCKDHRDRAVKCKHMFAVEFAIRREMGYDGSVTVEKTITIREKVTYKQDWSAYNAAQTQEKAHFQELLHGLCKDLPEPPRTPGLAGRPSLPISEGLFAVAFKVYSTLSGRRFNSDIAEAHKRGYISKVPHFNTILGVLERESLTPVLRSLIVETSRPLRAVETDFAVDSSGFTTTNYTRWFDVKYGRTMSEQDWVKVHLMCGVKTNVVTAVEILDKNAGDGPILPSLVHQTARTFDVREVSADSAYSSQGNMEAIHAVGATPYIAFKSNATGGVGGLYAKSYHYFNLHRDEFLKHYHKRSNVESTFSMIKAKFGSALRSKSETAMVNETLCKILCHNICCLIQAIYELGVTATFWAEEETASGKTRRPTTLEKKTETDVEAMAWL